MFLKSSSRCCILFLNGLGQVLTLSTNLSTADGHENWVERVEKKIQNNKLHSDSTNRKMEEKRYAWNICHFVSTAKLCTDVVCVK